MLVKGRDAIIYLAIKYKGDWDAIYAAISEKEKGPEQEEFDYLFETLGSNAITILDSEYPPFLRRIEKPPFVLFYHGDISLIKNYDQNLSVVGSREPDENVIDPTTKIIMSLAKRYTIISGLAKGIDCIAHNATLAAGGKTIAVLANGINHVYPSKNTDLYNIIKEKGLVISEYPYDVPPERWNFPFRNRIIVGLSKGIFIPNIHFLSGTYSSLSYALKFGKEVFVLPHPPFSQSANNRLINEGATLVNDPSDIIDNMGWKKHIL